MNNLKFDFNDISIIPEVISSIKSRNEINTYYKDDTFFHQLPLISAPMNSILSINEKDSYNSGFDIFMLVNNVRVTYPRGAKNINNSKYTNSFISFSIDEFEDVFINNNNINNVRYALVDVANGHMDRLLNLTKKVKNIYGDSLKIMVGNIANPETYRLYAEADIDYIRCGIGGGSACLTATNTATYMPMASLIHEIYQIKKSGGYKTKIVADGGFKSYADIIKAIAIGADYVMIGSILNKCLESDSKPYLWKLFPIKNMNVAEFLFKNKFSLYKKHIGMSTKEVQKLWGNKKLKTAEGIVKWNKVEYKLPSWIENFNDYLKSSMSYSNSRNLNEYIGEANFVNITNNAYLRFNK